MDSQAFTIFHVAISLIAIASGLIVIYGLLTGRRMPAMTALFLVTSVATSVTGFFFHRVHILPSHILGVLSLVDLAVTIPALYTFRLRGGWRAVYVVGAVIALYFNVFVLIAQSFLKVPFLHALAPTASTEPAFAGAQGAALAIFIVVAFLALRRFRPLAFS
jgi:hypothetical protein